MCTARCPLIAPWCFRDRYFSRTKDKMYVRMNKIEQKSHKIQQNSRFIENIGARTIFCLRALCFLTEIERRFSTPNRPMLMPRSIAVLENDRKSHNLNSFSALFAATGSLSTPVFISSYCASVSFPSLAHCAYKK